MPIHDPEALELFITERMHNVRSRVHATKT